jgi:hypothetical protein
MNDLTYVKKDVAGSSFMEWRVANNEVIEGGELRPISLTAGGGREWLANCNKTVSFHHQKQIISPHCK